MFSVSETNLSSKDQISEICSTIEIKEYSDEYKFSYKKTFDGAKLIKFEGWYPNKNRFFEENYINGKKEGLQYRWYPNDVLEFKENYKNGVYDGKQYKFDKNGKIIANPEFKDKNCLNMNELQKYHELKVNE